MRFPWLCLPALLLWGCPAPGPTRTDPSADKAVVSGYIENILNANRWDAYDQYFAPQVEFNGVLIGRADLERRVKSFRSAYPDFHMDIEEQIAEGGQVVTRVSCSGTHLGSDQGVPATGVKVRFSGIAIDRIKDGKVVGMRFLGDVWGRMQQIRSDL